MLGAVWILIERITEAQNKALTILFPFVLFSAVEFKIFPNQVSVDLRTFNRYLLKTMTEFMWSKCIKLSTAERRTDCGCATPVCFAFVVERDSLHLCKYASEPCFLVWYNYQSSKMWVNKKEIEEIVKWEKNDCTFLVRVAFRLIALVPCIIKSTNQWLQVFLIVISDDAGRLIRLIRLVSGDSRPSHFVFTSLLS